jgi:poly-gamma-glutamate synthesis protein (capsule biosynthesis protein)
VREDLATATESPGDLIVLLAGDLVLDAEDPDHWLAGIAPALDAADVAIGHLEVPHTRRGTELAGDVPAPPAAPEHLDALARAGFDMLSLAGNHIADQGADGIADTIERLSQLGIAHTGAAATLAGARRPARHDRGGRRIALLAYNSGGPEAAWAAADRAGCSYLKLATADGGPVTPMAEIEDLTEEAIWQLTDDIVSARSSADLVIVSLHKGVVHTPAVLVPYERSIAVAALAAGADIVFGHHAHILRGIEISAGRPVFHGLGNACVVTRALDPGQQHPARAAWARRRRELFGFEPDPRYELAPFHPEAVHGVLGIVIVHASGRLTTGVVPVHVEPPGRPVCVSDERAEAVMDYVERIGVAAGLPALAWHRQSPYLWVCK